MYKNVQKRSHINHIGAVSIHCQVQAFVILLSRGYSKYSLAISSSRQNGKS